ncbi:glycosyltransferase [Sphingomonas sp.]|uniref:glycosyltransferase n=1 Tax=Sphingomonas sp. TaxID=28214 RepID=UPI002ED81CFA
MRLPRLTGTPACGIAVPVRNEAAHLPLLLRALSRQYEAPTFGVALFFDSCTDDSYAIVRELAPTLPYRIEIGCSAGVAPPNAGRARAAAGALALSLSPGVILSTDADSEPAVDWVAANCAALEGADLVAGKIVIASAAAGSLHERLAAYYDRLHRYRRRIDPVAWEDDATHHWTATSLAVRADACRSLDGFLPLSRGEDADFADRAWREGYRLRRDARVVVRTSGRRQGRAEGGFAAMLADHDAARVAAPVSHPEDEAWRYHRHARARASFAAGEFQVLAELLGLSRSDVERTAGQARNADAFAACIVGAPPGGMRQISLAHAEIVLTAFDADMLEGAA